MAFSITTFTGDGVTTDFSTGFPVIELNDLTVKLDDVEQVRGIDYEVINFNSFGDTPTVRFFTAPAVDVGGSSQRFTNIVDLKSIFSNTSELNEFDLNKVNLQLLYSLQEADDRINNYINRVSGNNIMNQDLNMNNFRIKNLGIALADSDAIGKKQAEDLFKSIVGEGGVENPFDGEGYQIGQTAFSATDLTTLTKFEFVSRETTVQFLRADYNEFDIATNSAYDIGGGFFELPALVSPENKHKYYTRLK